MVGMDGASPRTVTRCRGNTESAVSPKNHRCSMNCWASHLAVIGHPSSGRTYTGKEFDGSLLSHQPSRASSRTPEISSPQHCVRGLRTRASRSGVDHEDHDLYCRHSSHGFRGFEHSSMIDPDQMIQVRSPRQPGLPAASIFHTWKLNSVT